MKKTKEDKLQDLIWQIEILEKYFSWKKDEVQLEKEVDESLGKDSHLKYASLSGSLSANYRMLRDDISYFLSKAKQIIEEVEQ